MGNKNPLIVANGESKVNIVMGSETYDGRPGDENATEMGENNTDICDDLMKPRLANMKMCFAFVYLIEVNLV